VLATGTDSALKRSASTQHFMNVPKTRAHTPWVVTISVSAAILVAAYGFAAAAAFRIGGAVRDYGWTAESRDGAWVIRDARPDTGLRVGDRLVAIDGDARAAVGWFWARLRTLPVDTPYIVEVRRAAAPQTVSIALRVGESRSPWNLADLAVFVLLGLAFAVTGWLVGLLRPDLGVARRMTVTWLVLAAGLVHQVLHPIVEYLTAPELLLNFVSEFFLFSGLAIMFAFYYEFPGKAAHGRFWTAIELVLFVWAGAISVALAVRKPSFLSGEPVVTLFGLPYLTAAIAFDTLVGLYVVVALAAMFAVTVRNYIRAREPDRRRRVRWVVYGTVAGIAPYLLTSVVDPRSSAGVRGPEVYTPLETFAAAALLLIPISAGYAVVKHRLFDIHIVVRRTVHFAIARGLLEALLLLPILALAAVVFAKPNVTLGEMLFSRYALFYVPLVATAALAMKYRTPVTAWVDRRFFRADYDREEILYRLLGRVGAVASIEDIAALVRGEVVTALAPQSFYFVTADDERSDLAIWLPSGPPREGLSIGRRSELATILAREKQALSPKELARAGLPAPALDMLASLGVELAVPMTGADERLDGVILLGPKRSEEPYAARDRKLLVAVGAQVALAYEAIELRERVERERRLNRDVLSRIEMANVDFTRECQICGRCYDAPAEICPADRGLVRLTLPIARTVDGRYRLERLLGKGGMGAVYEASDLRLQRSVAFKVLIADIFGDGAALRRFEREARVCARLSHPNVVTVYDYGPLGSHGAYIVMERLEGYTLRTVLERAGKLKPAMVARWFDELMCGVQAAHELGVIHRDIKPENVFVSRTAEGRTEIKVLDFGLGKALYEDDASGAITRSGILVGTVRYMSPEQLMGSSVDFRTDIFAIGVMIVEAVTGSRPFTGSRPAEILARIESGELGLDDSTPAARALKDALTVALAPDPERRYASVEAMRAAVVPALRACEGDMKWRDEYPDDASTDGGGRG
jgi:eukaryotic-like serine/threonine-protein kinase